MEEVVLVLWRLGFDDGGEGEDEVEGERCWVSFYVLFGCARTFSLFVRSVFGDGSSGDTLVGYQISTVGTLCKNWIER